MVRLLLPLVCSSQGWERTGKDQAVALASRSWNLERASSGQAAASDGRGQDGVDSVEVGQSCQAAKGRPQLVVVRTWTRCDLAVTPNRTRLGMGQLVKANIPARTGS